MTAYLKMGRREVGVSHPDKVLFPRARLTKLDLANHYERVAPVMLPYVRGRPLALQSFPGGIKGPGFFMKAVPGHFPDWIARATVPKRGGTVTHVLAEDAGTLVYLAGQNVVTPHLWLSRADEPRLPDRLILDFDPSGGGFADVRAAAREAGERLRDAGLATYAMTTGLRGIHVVCPLRRGPGFGDAHRFARTIAEEMVRDDPRRLTLEWKRADRGSRIYVDVNRNNYAQHAVAPYGVRASDRAPVATPVRWEELSDRSLKPDRWTMKTIGARIEAEGDPWKGMARHARGAAAMSALERIRDLCLSLPETSERLSHGSPAFFIGDKRTFVMYLDDHHGDGRLAIWCAAPEGAQAMLVDAAPEHYFVPPYVGHRGWLGVRLDRAIDFNEVDGAVEDAYLTVAPKRLVERYLA